MRSKHQTFVADTNEIEVQTDPFVVECCSNCQNMESHFMHEQTQQFLFIETFAQEKDKVLTEKQSEISLLKIQINAM